MPTTWEVCADKVMRSRDIDKVCMRRFDRDGLAGQIRRPGLASQGGCSLFHTRPYFHSDFVSGRKPEWNKGLIYMERRSYLLKVSFPDHFRPAFYYRIIKWRTEVVWDLVEYYRNKIIIYTRMWATMNIIIVQ